jgi:ParB family transcriptional regulator, chromosome partitioning protein
VARKPGLGKGLGALIPTAPGEENTTATASSEVAASTPLRTVPRTSIRPNPRQPRTQFNEDGLKALSESVAAIGILQPLLVREIPEEPGSYELIAGERRLRAASLANLETVPVLVRDDVNNLLSLEQAIVENLHREDLHALEEAAAYQQLIDDFDFTQEQVAERVSKSRTYVTNTLRLLKLGEAAQTALKAGKITAGHARALLAITESDQQALMVTKVVTNELSVRQTEDAVRTLNEPKPPVATGTTGTTATPPGRGHLRPVPDPSVVELENLLETLLETSVSVDLKGKNGRIVIDFADLDDLERIYLRMTGK